MKEVCGLEVQNLSRGNGQAQFFFEGQHGAELAFWLPSDNRLSLFLRRLHTTMNKNIINHTGWGFATHQVWGKLCLSSWEGQEAQHWHTCCHPYQHSISGTRSEDHRWRKVMAHPPLDEIREH